MKKENLGSKLLMAAVTLGVIAYFGVGIVRYFDDPLSATLAYAYQVSEGVDVTGYMVREERLLPDEDAGVLRLARAEGEKVSRGGTVATVYADAAALERQREVDELTTRIEQLRYAHDAALADEVSLKLDAQIRTALLNHRRDVAAGHLRDAESDGAQLRSLILKRDYTHDDAEDMEARIAELESQLKEKKAQTAASVRRITTEESGLWSAAVDGYENLLTPKSILGMTPAQLGSLEAENISSNTGKMVLGDKWYFAAVISHSEAEMLKKEAERGGTFALRFAKEAERDLPVALHFVSAEEGGKCVVVLEGETYLQELTMLRRQRAQIVTGTVEGIRVPKEALRAEKTVLAGGETEKTSVTGVYCIVGMEARFKPVEVLYTGESFFVVRAAADVTQESTRLRHGDQVIIRARGLYDGKVVG